MKEKKLILINSFNVGHNKYFFALICRQLLEIFTFNHKLNEKHHTIFYLLTALIDGSEQIIPSYVIDSQCVFAILEMRNKSNN